MSGHPRDAPDFGGRVLEALGTLSPPRLAPILIVAAARLKGFRVLGSGSGIQDLGFICFTARGRSRPDRQRSGPKRSVRHTWARVGHARTSVQDRLASVGHTPESLDTHWRVLDTLVRVLYTCG